MTISKKRNANSYTGAYLAGKGGRAASKAARLNVTIASFIKRFVNWTWARYFCAAMCENIKVGQAERVLRPFKDSIRNDALISVPIGVADAMISRHLDEMKNVLHEVRTNPQTT